MKYLYLKALILIFSILMIGCASTKKPKRHKKNKRGSYKTRCPSFSINESKNYYFSHTFKTYLS